MTNPANYNFKIQKGHNYKVPFIFSVDYPNFNELIFIAEIFAPGRVKVMNMNVIKDSDAKSIICSLTNVQTAQLTNDMTVSIKQVDATGYDPTIIVGQIELKLI